MKVALLAGTGSIHTIRWANGLSRAGVDVHLLTQHEDLEPVDKSVRVHRFPFRGMAGYYLMVPGVRQVLRRISPDLLNAHYASGYGTTARLAGFRPCLLSVWGSDVYDVPERSFLHKHLVRSNLLAADVIASTSHCMARQVRKLVPEVERVEITPFGVEMSRFYEDPASIALPERATQIVIGTVKGMTEKYGIDTLIQAFSIVYNQLMDVDEGTASRLRLRLVGDGSQISELKSLAKALRIADRVVFTGRLPHEQVATELTKFDVFVALSRLDSESFGVAVIEAGAAGLPVVVSNVGGLPEVVVDGRTGLIVSRDDPGEAARAIMQLVLNPDLRTAMGCEARRHVNERYAWESCVADMIRCYERVIQEVEIRRQ